MNRRKGRMIRGGVNTVLASVFGLAFYDRYWRHRDCFNAEGNCWVSAESINYTTSGFVWGLVALVFALFALIRLAQAFRS